MKLYLSFLIIILSTPIYSQSQEATRQYLREKLVFYFISDPTTAKPSDMSSMEVDKNTIAQGNDLTTVLWTDTANVGLKNLLIKLLRSSRNGGDFRLQRIVRNVLLISDKKVYVYLYADFTNGTHDSSWPVYCIHPSYPSAHNQASWPCASMFTDRTLEASGHIGIGAYFLHPSRPGSAGGWVTDGGKGSVFVHELTHTQLPLVLESNLGSTPMYGSDWVSHSFSELLPSRNSAFNEGIANAFAFRYDLAPNLGMTRWFNSNVTLRVDNISGCSGTPTPDKCLQQRLTNASVSNLTPCASGMRCYSIRDVPAPILMNCENVTANLLFQYMQQFRSDLILVRAIKRAMTDMNASSSGYIFAPLFKEMVKSGMNYSNPNRASGTSTHGQHLPLAILDYYTGYRLNSKTALESVIDDTWESTDTNIDSYFSRLRTSLISYRSNSTDWNVTRQLSRFARDLNVRDPQPQATTPQNE